ncbi:C2H2 finger domain protein [Penicillium angulare]|uniref:C2H2 finger domain protein n=1 Tax=Penicillium angulare TaxID=116970 RepID=UPI00253F6DFB|nr:C2H2 finger domain protein [Penicillium angulare]KAJ5291421.1 C2H2 finger domain protein [Penicillium angulare]
MKNHERCRSIIAKASQDPGNKNAVLQVIERRDQDWVDCFKLQSYHLTPWWMNAREALAQLSPSMEDIDWGVSSPPYRAFGSRASIALVSYCFSGLADISAWKEYHWDLDLKGLLLMLHSSPAFEEGVTAAELQQMIKSLKVVFEFEDKRCCWILPQIINLNEHRAVIAYYERAFAALDPRIIPKLCSRLFREQIPDFDIENQSMKDYAIKRLAKAFHNLSPSYGPGIFKQLGICRVDTRLFAEILCVKLYESSKSNSIVRVIQASPSPNIDPLTLNGETTLLESYSPLIGPNIKSTTDSSPGSNNKSICSPGIGFAEKLGEKPSIPNTSLEDADKNLYCSSESGSLRFRCLFAPYGCKATFNYKSSFKRHITTIHVVPNLYRCEICLNSQERRDKCRPTEFVREDMLIEHQRRVHHDQFVKGGEGNSSWHHGRYPPTKSQCPFCQELFLEKNGWNKRMEHSCHEEGNATDAREDSYLTEWALETGTVKIINGKMRLVCLNED